MYFIILSILVLFFAILSIFARQQNKISRYSFFKPITTGLIVLISILSYFKSPNDYSVVMISSLVFALIGDVFLLNKKFFIYGLFSFLVAHIGFTFGFVSLFGFSWNIVTLMILLMVFLVYFKFLKNNLSKYLIPVLLYMLVIVIMSWQAIGLFFNNNSLVFAGIAISSLLFFFSDALIAYKKFVKPFSSIEVYILSTYWLAIYTFAISGIFIQSI